MKKLIVAIAISMLLAGSAMAASIAEHAVTPVNFDANLLANEAPTCSATLSTTEAAVYWFPHNSQRQMRANKFHNLDVGGSDGSDVVVTNNGDKPITITRGNLVMDSPINIKDFARVKLMKNNKLWRSQSQSIRIKPGKKLKIKVFLELFQTTTLSDIAGEHGLEATFTLPLSYTCIEG